MLEILLLAWLCSSIGKVLRSKGRKPLVFQILLVASWFGAEFCAGIVGGGVQAIRAGDRPPPGGFDFTIYLFALVGAACAAGFWFLIVYLIPPKHPDYSTAKFAGPSGASPVYQPPADPNNPYASPRVQD